MKRDMNLIRKILLVVEESDTAPADWVDVDIPAHDPLEVSYHVKLLVEAGLPKSN